MLQNGTRVKIIDKTLKSNQHKGTFVGYNSKGQYKIYLDEPISKGSKTTVYLITLSSVDSFELIYDYSIEEVMQDYIKEKISSIEKTIEELKRLM